MNSTNPTNGFPAARLGRGMADLAHDATAIAELQAKLLALDLKSGARFIRRSVIFACIGGTLILASLPVALLGIAELLVDAAGWQKWVAYLVAAGAALLVSCTLLWLSWAAVRQSAGSMRRSNEELARNLQWLKTELRGRQPLN